MMEENPNLPTDLFPFLWYFLRQMKWQFLAVLLFFGLTNALVAIQPLFFKLFIDVFESTTDKSQIWKNVSVVLFWYILLIVILQPITAQIGNWIQSYTMPVWVNMMRRQLARYMHNHSYAYFQDDFAGRLAGKVTETPMAAGMVVSTFIGSLWYGIIMAGTALVLFSLVHAYFAWMLVGFLVCVAITLSYFIPKIRFKSKRASDFRSIVRGRFVDAISNILTIKLFARAKYEDEYFLEALRDTSDKYVDLKLTTWRLWICMEILSVGFYVGVMLMLIWIWQQGSLGVAEVALVLPMTLQVVHTTWWMAEISTELFQGFGEIQEGIEKITKGHDVADKEKAGELKLEKASINFNAVSFSYDQDLIFDDLSLDIKPGEKIGLIGPSGAGKSTLIQILLRMYDVNKGTISISDQNIAEVTQDSLRRQISAIPQASDLLHRSIMDNIRYGRLDATDEEVIEAAKKASAHEFIMTLKDRDGNSAYDTLVGERGVKLSGGQRQRVAIARAILKDAPILILDEATSALDSESERLIQNSLKGLMDGRTVIAIAHRLSTISHLDRLIVMDEGKIVEQGTHTELLEKKGLYARLWSMQSGGFLGE